MNDKNIETSGVMETPAAPARAHNAGDGAVGAGPAGRFSAQRKLAAVQRLLRGEALEMVSRELNVLVHRLSQWRDRVLEAAMSALKAQEQDARDDEVARLKTKKQRPSRQKWVAAYKSEPVTGFVGIRIEVSRCRKANAPVSDEHANPCSPVRPTFPGRPWRTGP